MAIERRGNPDEVSLTACPFDECGAGIGENESFANHWKECDANPANGGAGGFPSERNGRADE